MPSNDLKMGYNGAAGEHGSALYFTVLFIRLLVCSVNNPHTGAVEMSVHMMRSDIKSSDCADM